MATAFEASALQRSAPNSSASTSTHAAQTTAIGAASSGIVPIPGVNLGEGSWITLKPTSACHIVFGTDQALAATLTDEIFFAGSVEDYYLRPGITHFRVIQDTAPGTLYWHRSCP